MFILYFLDGNKRTTPLVTMFFIKVLGLDKFDTNFFKGILSLFLVDMLEEKMKKEKIENWIEKQLSSEM